MNQHDLLIAFSGIDPAYRAEAERRAADPAGFFCPQKRKISMKRIVTGLTAAAAAGALIIGTGVYLQKNAGYTVQTSNVAMEPVTETTAAAVESSGTETNTVLSFAEAGSDLTAGQHVLFGDYEWRVLETQDDRALLITEYGIACRPYNDELTDVTWETCSLRAWLNDDFYNSFSEEDRARILTVTNENPDNDIDGAGFDMMEPHTVLGGNDTEDRFFCLSKDELEYYFTGGTVLCKPSQTALDKDVYGEDGYCYWWLRSLSTDNRTVMLAAGKSQQVFPFSVFGGTVEITLDSIAVRPAVWVKTNP